MTASPALLAALVWLLLANVLAMLPSKDNHWRRAYMLIGTGVPILIWLVVSHGPILGLLFLAAAMSVLRWPVIYLGRWIKAKLGPRDE